jgi:hypothetical protein
MLTFQNIIVENFKKKIKRKDLHLIVNYHTFNCEFGKTIDSQTLFIVNKFNLILLK